MSRTKHRSKQEKDGKVHSLKSRLETQFWAKFPELDYEPKAFKYVDEKKYTPDWRANDKIYLETKGLFKADDRKKHLLMQEQHPEIEVIFVFENADKKIHPKSTTTYGEWCDRHHIRWHDWRKIKDSNITIQELIDDNAN